MIEDVTERKEASDRIAESERKYRELVELANSIILRWDPQGRITFLNEYGQRFFGYSAEEIIGQNVMDVIVPRTESSGRDLQLLMEQICGNPAAFEQNVNENVRRNGERAWIAWTNRIVQDAQGRIVEILSVGTDITARRQAEQEILELNASLERRVTESAPPSCTPPSPAPSPRIVSSPPFSPPCPMSCALPAQFHRRLYRYPPAKPRRPAQPAEQSKQLGMVQGSARHLLELINDVLDLSKIEAGQLEVRPEAFDLRASLHRVVAVVRPLAEKKGITLEAVVSADIGEMISDRRRVEQIVLNLLNNAVKFTEQGGVTLQARLLPGAQSPAVCLEVEDTGVGVKPEDLASLFKPFRQIDSGLSRQHEGTGLGLAICRRLAALLKGEISVKSQWAHGSRFIVTLPLNAAWRT